MVAIFQSKIEKNIFVANRLKDIGLFKEEIYTGLKVFVNFKYVSSDQNPTDLITKKLTLTSFKSNLDFWIKGLAWLTVTPVLLPKNELKCLSDTDKSAVQTGAYCHTAEDRNRVCVLD